MSSEINGKITTLKDTSGNAKFPKTVGEAVDINGQSLNTILEEHSTELLKIEEKAPLIIPTLDELPESEIVGKLFIYNNQIVTFMSDNTWKAINLIDVVHPEIIEPNPDEDNNENEVTQ